jgi:hypothetical protein
MTIPPNLKYQERFLMAYREAMEVIVGYGNGAPWVTSMVPNRFTRANIQYQDQFTYG